MTLADKILFLEKVEREREKEKKLHDPIMDYVIDYKYDSLDVYPEAESIIRRLIKEYKQRLAEMSKEFSKHLIEYTKTSESDIENKIRLKVKMYGISERETKCRQIIYYLKRQLPSKKEYKNQITDEMIEKAKQVPLESLVTIKRTLPNAFLAICPFHEDKKPSLNISNSKNLYYCFVCGSGGTSITYVMKTQNLSFKEAVLKLCK